MRIYLRDLGSFFRWMDGQGLRYAVMRGHDFMDTAPARGSRDDIDILLEDAAMAPVRRQFRSMPRQLGYKCDFYSVSPGLGGDFVGGSYFPETLSQALLERRVRSAGGYYVPADRELYFSLLYHVAYQKAERSGCDAFDAGAFKGYKRAGFVAALGGRLGLPGELSLFDMHGLLTAEGYGLTFPCATRYLQNHFKRRFKSTFYAHLLRRAAENELNLFVLRAKAVRRGFRQALLDEIGKHYEVLAVKDIPWMTRWRKARFMRGNKWRWGGWPVTAVAVLDREPAWRDDAARAEEHPLVFNSRQFFKRALREQIIREGRLYHKDNALHSTDNEAEAVGHMDLFFSPEEERAIYARAGRHGTLSLRD